MTEARDRVRDAAACPRCGAAAGEPCRGDGGGVRRKGKNHRERSAHKPWQSELVAGLMQAETVIVNAPPQQGRPSAR